MNKQTKIKELANLLQRLSKAYYEGEALVPDAEFDRIQEKLRVLSPDHPVLAEIGAKPEVGHLQKATHTIQMFSLSKASNKEEFIKWAKKTGSDSFVVSEKFDGLSIELVYEEGRFKQAITRGDGAVGENVSRNVRQIAWVEPILNGFSGSLRGEVIISKKEFEEYFREDDYSTPRNAAAGFVRRKNPDPRLKYLQFIAFDCVCEEKEFTSKKEQLKFMKEELQLKMIPFKVACLEDVLRLYDFYVEKRRDRLPYEIDGLVVDCNDYSFRKLGVVDGRPKYAIAFKFPPKGKESIVIDITWEVGRTGRLSPLCHVKPVEVGGVTISKASVYNLTYIKELGLGVGSKVLVVRAGDVIPRIEQVIDSKGEIEVPTDCPICKTTLIQEGEYILCSNEHCPGRRLGDFQKWVEVTEIEEAGPAFLKDIMSTNLFDFDVEDISDLYKLTPEHLMLMEGYKKTKSSKIIRNINKAKKLPLETILAGLNIPNVGRRVCKKIVEAGYDNLDDLYEVSIEDLEKLEGIGSIKANLFHEGIRNKRKVLAKLFRNGVEIMKKKEGRLTGQSFCFTGALSIKRNDAKKMVEDLGGEFKSSVSKGLTYLVQADPDSNSTKARKAREIGTKVIGEDDFMKLVDFEI